MKNKKGYILTWDALLALMILIITFLTLLGLGYFSPSLGDETDFEKIHYVGDDVLDILDKNKVLEKIVFYWSTNQIGEARKLADYYLNTLFLVPRQFSYRLEIEGQNISQRDLGLSEDKITARTSVIRFISGYQANNSPDVFVARAWLWYNDSKKNKTYSLESVNYKNSFLLSLGGNWTFNHTGVSKSSKICIPTDCSGDDKHNYTTEDHAPPQNEDALDDAVYRLMDKLDSNDDGIIDLPFDSENMTFKVSSVSTKKLHGIGEVKLILWV